MGKFCECHNEPFDVHSQITLSSECNLLCKLVKLSMEQAVEAHYFLDVEDPTFSRQSARRWPWSCESYAPPVLCPPGIFLVPISVRSWDNPRFMMRLEGLDTLKKKINYLNLNRNWDFSACSLVPQPTRNSGWNYCLNICFKRSA
jgi:hypothetical protein